jgi:hypothetical protein
MAEAISRKVQVAAKVQASAGTVAQPSEVTDGILMYDDTDIVSVDTDAVDVVPLKVALTPTKSLIGRQLYNFSGKSFLQSSGTAGTAGMLGPLMECCALGATVTSSPDIVTYAPVSTGFKSTTIVCEMDGLLHRLQDTRGTFTMSGSAGQGVEITFDLKGLYEAPAVSIADCLKTTSDANAAAFSGAYVSPSNRAVTMKSAGLIINPNAGGSNSAGAWDEDDAEPLVFKSFSFDRGATIGERTDANATDALQGLAIESTEPTLEIVVEGKNTLTGVVNAWTDLTGAFSHNVTFDHGTVAGNTWSFAFPEVSLTDVTSTSGEGGTRNWTFSYKVQHDTGDSEFTLTEK